jgi:hypothetical protein
MGFTAVGALLGAAMTMLSARPARDSMSDSQRTEDFFASIKTKFELITATTHERFPDYKSNMWGIASTVPGEWNYGTAKTRWIFDQLLAARDAGKIPPKPVICETGMNAGHSAILFLDALPNSTFYEFDFGDLAWAVHNGKKILTQAYAGRFEYIQGDGATNLRKFARERPGIKCDVLFIDGVKGKYERMRDVYLFRKISSPTALIFGDEANTIECMSGAVPETDPLCNEPLRNGHPLFTTTEYAWNALARDGEIYLHGCSSLHIKGGLRDVVCMWTWGTKNKFRGREVKCSKCARPDYVKYNKATESNPDLR